MIICKLIVISSHHIWTFVWKPWLPTGKLKVPFAVVPRQQKPPLTKLCAPCILSSLTGSKRAWRPCVFLLHLLVPPWCERRINVVACGGRVHFNCVTSTWSHVVFVICKVTINSTFHVTAPKSKEVNTKNTRRYCTCAAYLFSFLMVFHISHISVSKLPQS